jgi:hypothetical protein
MDKLIWQVQSKVYENVIKYTNEKHSDQVILLFWELKGVVRDLKGIHLADRCILTKLK